MITISQKTLDDLEFDAVVAQIASFSITQLGKAKIQQLTDVVELLNKRILELQNEVENLKSEKPKSTRTKKTAPEDGGSF